VVGGPSVSPEANYRVRLGRRTSLSLKLVRLDPLALNQAKRQAPDDGSFFGSVKNMEVFAAGHMDVFTPVPKKFPSSGAGQSPMTFEQSPMTLTERCAS
jgi:hypothetical protein